MAQLAKSTVNNYLDHAQLEASLYAAHNEKTLTNDSIAMLFGIVIGVMIFFILFIYVAYYMPWWGCFLSSVQFCNLKFINCIYCYYYCCPNLEAKIAQEQRLRQRDSVFVQDMYASPNGNILHTSDIRPMCSKKQTQPGVYKYAAEV